VTEALRIIDSTDAAPAELEVFYDEILAPSFILRNLSSVRSCSAHWPTARR